MSETRINPYLGDKPEECGFTTQQEFLDAVGDLRYEAAGQAGVDFREAVAVMLKQSDFAQTDITTNEAKAATRRVQWQAEEDAAILREHGQALFDDPKYQSSTLFRRQVREQIVANQELIEKTLPSTKQPTKLNMRVQFGADEYNEVVNGIKKQADEQRAKDAKAAAAEVERRAALPYVDVLGGNSEGDDE